MDPIQNATIASTPTATNGRASDATQGLGSQDFLKLLITQLTNQDPLEPTNNEELLRQISSIREIELSSTLTDSLRSLTGQQRFASASTLIGQYVMGVPGPDGAAQRGVVVGVRFETDGRPILRLSNGTDVPLDQVASIDSPVQAGESLIGQSVTGVDRRDARQAKPVEGTVTGVRMDEQNEAILELDSGDSLRLRDVVEIMATAA